MNQELREQMLEARDQRDEARRERDMLLGLLREMAAADPSVAATFRGMSDKAEWYLLDDVLPD